MRTPLLRTLVVSIAFSSTGACSSLDVLGERRETSAVGADATEGSGAAGGSTAAEEPEFEAENVLETRQDVPLTQVNAKVNDAFLQLFFGDPDTQAVFRDQGDGTGYMEDIANNDVRTDAVGYGMLVTVQLDQREVFDKIWAWTKQYMLATSGEHEGLIRWRCDTSGNNCDDYAATDASSIITTTLFMAHSRWGAGGSHEYRQDALDLLEAMTTVEERYPDGVQSNLFDVEEAFPRNGSGGPLGETPTDYLMPAFYEIWAGEDVTRSALWRRMADNSRTLLSELAHPESGLLPHRVSYDGTPVPGQESYLFTTSRTLFNLALDYRWNGQAAWITEQNERLLDFFLTQGIDDYVTEYGRDGTPISTINTTSHIALAAMAAGTSSDERYAVFLEGLLEEPIPSGTFRYFDGMFYMLSLLTLSGQMSPD